MENFEEQAQKLLDKPHNLLYIAKNCLIEQNRRYNNLKKCIVEMEGALIRAGLPFKKIEYKGKNQTEWRKW